MFYAIEGPYEPNLQEYPLFGPMFETVGFKHFHGLSIHLTYIMPIACLVFLLQENQMEGVAPTHLLLRDFRTGGKLMMKKDVHF
jgi:hypothetical protein